MQLARVIGRVTSTVKHASLRGQRLLLVSMLDASGKAELEPQLVLDEMGARAGDTVMVTTDSVDIARITKSNNCPARWSVQGIPDEQQLKAGGLDQLLKK